MADQHGRFQHSKYGALLGMSVPCSLYLMCDCQPLFVLDALCMSLICAKINKQQALCLPFPLPLHPLSPVAPLPLSVLSECVSDCFQFWNIECVSVTGECMILPARHYFVTDDPHFPHSFTSLHMCVWHMCISVCVHACRCSCC